MKKAPDNPAFKILKLELCNFKEQTGDDVAYWNIELKTNDYRTGTMLMFEKFWDFCREHHLKESTYFSAVRDSIKGLGPKHGQMFEIFLEEGFDFKPLITEYIQNVVDLDAYHQHDLQIQTLSKDPKALKRMDEKVNEMDALIPAMKKSHLRMEDFADSVFDHANKEALRLFPELVEGSPQLIRKLQGVLIRSVRDLTEEIEKLTAGS